ncbi:MAG: hypothetical protein KJ058_17635, partial [Thermoanaerobaculia bacterium]|nr:hypothetical protein [Thermoanaerobaculia bacterium]
MRSSPANPAARVRRRSRGAAPAPLLAAFLGSLLALLPAVAGAGAVRGAVAADEADAVAAGDALLAAG